MSLSLSRRTWVARAVLLGLCLGTAPALYATEAVTQPTAAVSAHARKRPDLLFTQLASSATIAATGTPNTYLLTLNDVSSSTTWFTDRPERKTGVVTTEEFVRRWDTRGSQFEKDAPNANIVIFTTTAQGVKESTEHVVELTDPHYEAKSHVLSYHIKLLPSRTLSTSKFPTTGKTEEVALFIDGWFGFNWTWGSL
jgi:ketopantoate hydroxymethyltransferase